MTMPEGSDRFDKGELLQQLTQLQRVAEQRALLNADTAFPAESDEVVGRIRQLIDSLAALDVTHPIPVPVDEDRDLPPASGVAISRGLSAADLSTLRDHVISMNGGQFSQDDQYST